MINQQHSSSGKRLTAYFYSGWAFLIPYLLTYLLYHWQKWPANSFAPSALGNGGYIPALLHVYWALHAIHLVLAIIALRVWWRNNSTEDFNPIAPSGNVRKSRFDPYSLLPWVLLALIFWIPGVYLEWPSDPWEHLRRITEWSIHPIAGEHSAGYKSFYFFAYSFISVPPDLSRFGNVNIYGTCIDLLLAWQYYRLAKAVGLNQRWSFLFVLGNALAFGNVCFSFYKYYTLATTMYAQLGAVALTRITLDFVQESKNENGRTYNLRRLPRLLTEYAVCIVLLLVLVACNHVQGVGIAGLGIGSIIVWRLLDWKRSAAWWLVAASVILSIATILWWPRHAVIDRDLRPGGWLNAWYGFNLVAWPSPSADRAVQIVGLLGLINLSAGIWLVMRKHPAGWLIVGPIIALLIPFAALPLADTLGANNFANIITFQRMLFAIPSGIGVAICAREWLSTEDTGINQASREASVITLFSLIIIISATPSAPTHGRSWNLLSSTPADLQLKPIITLAKFAETHSRVGPGRSLLTTDATAFASNTISPAYFPFRPRSHVFQSEIADRNHAIAIVHSTQTFFDPKIKILNDDPLIAHSSAWITFAGSQPQFISNVGNFAGGLTALQNQAGLYSDVFTSDLIPIEKTKSYQLEFSARQYAGANATVFLAVAWYDENGILLASDQPAPAGAGSPPGWLNGTYSYFGLLGSPPPKTWTTYRTSFGLSEIAAIPPRAKSIRLGALLNYSHTPDAVVQLTNVRLWQKAVTGAAMDGTFPSEMHSLVVCPCDLEMWSFTSQAALAARHWPANQVAFDLGGTAELRMAAIAAGARPLDGELAWELQQRTKPRP